MNKKQAGDQDTLEQIQQQLAMDEKSVKPASEIPLGMQYREEQLRSPCFGKKRGSKS